MSGAKSQSRPVRHALVVEDSASLRALIAGAVTSLGFEVDAVADSKSAMKAFAHSDPDLLIADVDLGSRPNGVELAHILRSQAPYLGIVFLTLMRVAGQGGSSGGGTSARGLGRPTPPRLSGILDD